MIRKLLIACCAISLLFLTSCSTDSPSDDDMASESGSEAAPDQAAADNSGTEDLSGELNNTTDADNAAPSEQGLENELDNNNSDDLSNGPPADNKAAEAPKDEELSLTDEPPAAKEEVAPVPGPVAAPEAPVAQNVRITNIRYLSNQAGGTVVVEGTGPLSYHSHSEGSQFVIDVDNAELPENLKKPTPVRDFSGAFTSIHAEQSSPTQARIVVQMKSGKGGEPIVQTEGNSLLIVPTSAPIVAESNEAPKTEAPHVDEASPLAAHTLDEFLTGNQKFYGKPISVQTKDADIRDVINFISEESGANIIMSDDVKGKVSLKIRRIPWDQVLVSVMRSKALGYVRQGNVLRISSLDELQKESDQALKMIETQKNMAPVRVKVIPVNYANVDDLVKQMPSFLSKEGKAVADPRSNTILITDRENILDRVESLVKALDIQPNQVMIEGKIVEAQQTFTSFIGVNWNMTGSPLQISSGGGYNGAPVQLTPGLTSNSFNSQNAPNVMNTGINFGTLDFVGNLGAALQLAENDNQVRVISSPRIAAMNKEKAEIRQGDQIITIATLTTPGTSTTQTTPQAKDIKLDLIVTPQITSDSSVIMDVEVTREFPGPVVDSGTQARATESRFAKSKILVRNGQTAVIGGIYQNSETNADNGVPGLMDIPVVGWLFKSRQKDRTKNELLIFLTPRIMQQSMAQAAGSGAPG